MSDQLLVEKLSLVHANFCHSFEALAIVAQPLEAESSQVALVASLPTSCLEIDSNKLGL